MRGTPLRFDELTGGLNVAAGEYGLAKNETRRALNVQPSERGSVFERLGDEQMFIVAGELDVGSLGYQPQIDANGPGLLIGTIAAGGKLYRWTSGAGLELLDSGVDPRFGWIVAPVSGGQGPIFGASITEARQYGVAPIAAWTASAGTVPLTPRLLYHANRAWAIGGVAGVSYSYSAVAWSELGDVRNWPAANVNELDPADSRPLTAAGVVPAGIIVFNEFDGWLIYDLDTGANRPLGGNVGCVSHRSCASSPYGLIFLSRDRGVCITDGSGVKAISEKIEPLLLDLVADVSDRQRIYGTFWQNKYLLTFPALLAGESAKLLEYDFLTQSWWFHLIRGSHLIAADLSGGSGTATPELYAAGTDGVQPIVDHIMARPGVDALGAPLDSRWLGPFHALGNEHARVRAVTFEGHGALGVDVYRDYLGPADPSAAPDAPETSGAAWYSFAPAVLEGPIDPASGTPGGSTAASIERKLPELGVADSVALQFSGNGWVLNAYTLYTTARRG